MKKEITGIVLADEHFGVIDANRLYDEHRKIIISFLNELKSLDVIFIAGDFFDHILYLNELHANKACSFMDELVFQANRLGSKIRIIYGTESHECNQYNIFFNRFFHSDVDFKVISTASEEELFDDFWVLYLPEEYMYNKTEWYADFFTGDKKYNYIIGHGVIQELMSDASYHMTKSSKNSNRAKVPIFTSTELLDNCKGEVYFGHYHVNTSMKDKIFYVGSFSRWEFGEEQPKGFYYIKFKNEKYSHEFIENTMTEKYITFSYGYEHEIFKSKEAMEQEWKKIERLVSENVIEHVRLNLNVPDSYPEAESLLAVLSERFKNQKNIKIKVTNGYIDKSRKINKEYLKDTIKKYAFIFDKNMPIAEQSHQFILTKFDQDIPTERIDWHLKTKDILSNEETDEEEK